MNAQAESPGKAGSSALPARLRVWLFDPYGSLPGESWRAYRSETIGAALTAAGHEVTWWTSNFSHHFKTFRSEGWEDRRLESGMIVRLVPTTGYYRNVGPARLVRDVVFGWRAYRRGASLNAPHLIITSEPVTMLGLGGVRLAVKKHTALIYDQLDLWPELMVQLLPNGLKRVAQIVLWPIFRVRRSIFLRIDGAMALAKPYLNSVLDELPLNQPRPALLLYNGIDVPAFRHLMAGPLSAELSHHFQRPGLKAIFAGTLGPNYDVTAMIDAAAMLAREGREESIYIAGDGPERARVEAAAAKCPNLCYLGKLSPQVLPSVYAQCDVGLSCYAPRSNVEMCDKFYDYCAAGLIIVNSLVGEVRDWITNFDLGLQYEAGSGESLSRALQIVTNDPEQRAALKAASWNISMRFDRSACYAVLPAWVRDVVVSKGRAQAA